MRRPIFRTTRWTTRRRRRTTDRRQWELKHESCTIGQSSVDLCKWELKRNSTDNFQWKQEEHEAVYSGVYNISNDQPRLTDYVECVYLHCIVPLFYERSSHK
jgi:hypothetical protein